MTVTSLHDFCIKTCTDSFPVYTLYCNFICVLSYVIIKDYDDDDDDDDVEMHGVTVLTEYHGNVCIKE